MSQFSHLLGHTSKLARNICQISSHPKWFIYVWFELLSAQLDLNTNQGKFTEDSSRPWILALKESRFSDSVRSLFALSSGLRLQHVLYCPLQFLLPAHFDAFCTHSDANEILSKCRIHIEFTIIQWEFSLCLGVWPKRTLTRVVTEAGVTRTQSMTKPWITAFLHVSRLVIQLLSSLADSESNW